MEENTTEKIIIMPKNKRNKCLRKRRNSSDEEIKEDSDEDIRFVHFSLKYNNIYI